jgi:hypothetical protein
MLLAAPPDLAKVREAEAGFWFTPSFRFTFESFPLKFSGSAAPVTNNT